MPPDHQTEAVSLALSLGIVAVAAALLLWLWLQRRGRDADIPPDDARHFARQDGRRALVAAILLVLALIIFIGSPMQAKVGGRTNLVFVGLWLSAFALIFMLLLLAMFDWLATRFYARRHIQQLARERLEILREERLRLASRDRPHSGPDPPLSESPAI